MDYVIYTVNLNWINNLTTFSWGITEADIFHDDLNTLKEYLKEHNLVISDGHFAETIRSYEVDYKPYMRVRYITKETKEILEETIGTNFGLCTLQNLLAKMV